MDAATASCLFFLLTAALASAATARTGTGAQAASVEPVRRHCLSRVRSARGAGRGICIHEQVCPAANGGGRACGGPSVQSGFEGAQGPFVSRNRPCDHVTTVTGGLCKPDVKSGVDGAPFVAFMRGHALNVWWNAIQDKRWHRPRAQRRADMCGAPPPPRVCGGPIASGPSIGLKGPHPPSV